MSIALLSAGSAAFKKWFKSIAEQRRATHDGIEGAVAAIVEAVRERGDSALIEFSRRYDGVSLSSKELRLPRRELERALERLERTQRRALELAARRIRDFHRRTLERPFAYRDAYGMRLGQFVRPLNRVGIYVPGGSACYPSTVLMNAIPAQVAGVPELVMACPAASPRSQPAVLAAAALAGVKEVYRIGGAQAVAAMAYGTETIAAVDKIVGPGNAYVQSAKRMIYGVVDIDMIAGPSEVLVIADDSADPRWVAADLIAQAEHGSGDEAAILITTSHRIGMAVGEALEEALLDLPRAGAVRSAIERRGGVVVVADLRAACELANKIAPEHLELEVREPRKWLKEIHAAGAIFLGGLSPAPLGDYLAGPNHVLPTSGSARFASPLGAYDFLKRTSIIQATPAAIESLGPVVAQLARMEGFEGHARAIEARLPAVSRPRGKRKAKLREQANGN